MGAIWQVFGTDAHSMTMRLLQACDAIALVPRNGSVALKPNLVLASSPEAGAVTHPGLVVVDSICGDLCFEEGGTPVQTNRMYAGTDLVQIDAYGCPPTAEAIAQALLSL